MSLAANQPAATSLVTLITGKLEPEKEIVGEVLVQGLDDPVTVAPGFLALLVEFKTVAFSETGDIEPVLCPAFAVSRRGEEPFHHLVIGRGS